MGTIKSESGSGATASDYHAPPTPERAAGGHENENGRPEMRRPFVGLIVDVRYGRGFGYFIPVTALVDTTHAPSSAFTNVHVFSKVPKLLVV